MKPSITEPKYRPWLTCAGAVALIVGFLLVQNARHGWPFSLHHGMQTQAQAAQTAASPEQSSPHEARVAVELSPVQYERLGVQIEPARLERISRSARYTAIITTDESRISHVHTRVSGWIEQLRINITGQVVRAGQPLAEVFSQELFASQNEYLSALRQSKEISGSAVVDAARTRLTVLGMSAADIAALEQAGKPRRTFTVIAPRNGVVLRRGVTVGTAVDASTELLTIADLSRVWVLAEVPESESAQLSVGSEAMLAFPASGRPPFAAKVDFVYPTLSERTRTVRVRFAVDNRDSTLRPGLYGTVAFGASTREALTVARDAVVDTGTTQHVFVQTSEGTLEPRTVSLGTRLADRIEILAGLSAGDPVVSSGVFLVDSESRLRASGGSGHLGHGGQRKENGPQRSEEAAHTAAHSDHGSSR
jgi:membrane fusion protein, copper/silver efflux system